MGRGLWRRHAVRAGLAGACLASLLAGAALLDHLLPPDMARARSFALILQARDGTVLDGRTSHDGTWRLPTQSQQVDPTYLALLLQTEDRRFAWHPGIDPLSLSRASWQLLTHGHIVSGGSTLAMQASRLLMPHPHTWGGKLADLLRALQLEWRYGHTGTLDLYLTLTPEGGNIEGIRAASLLYFGHEPAHLSPAEAALLVALPRKPAAFRPDRHPQALRAAAQGVLAHAQQPLPALWPHPTTGPHPHDAPEVLAFLWGSGRRDTVHSTLDAAQQRTIRTLLTRDLPPRHGTLAALVANHEHEITTWVGGSEHSCPSCAIDMVLAPRSPGSALKPFIYGMALDAGWLTPATRLRDSRMAVGNYAPHDYGHTFYGETTAARALQLSLNIPAILVLQKIGAATFRDHLARCGVVLRLPDATATPSLALALGGEAVTLRELVTLYAAIDHAGTVAPLVLDHTAPPPPPMDTHFASPRATADLRAILRGTHPPAGTSWHDVAFKTGTSYGGRDAWAMATTGRWTVGVWAGRPDGTATPGLTGRGVAGPVLGRIITLLQPPPPIPTTLAMAPAHLNTATLSTALHRMATVAGPQIITPTNGAELENSPDPAHASPIGLEAAGGVPPYRWYVNGTPVSVPPGASAAWLPDGPGFTHISVTDAQGLSAQATIRIRDADPTL